MGSLTLVLFALAPLRPAHAADDTALRLANTSASNTAYVRIPNDSTLALQQFTLEAWVQRVGAGFGQTTDAVGGAVLAKPTEGAVGSFLGPWYLTWNNSGQAFLSVAHIAGVNGVTLLSAPVTTPLGRHHLAAVVSADSVKLYVDGVLSTAAPWTLGTVAVTVSDVLIGACNFGSGFLRRLDGVIDDVRIWNRARSRAEIVAQMDCRLTGHEPGLVAYYTFDASTLNDDTGHAHTGTAVATAGSLTYASLTSLSACVTAVEPGSPSDGTSFLVSPQPSRGMVRVRFGLPRPGPVSVSAYDVSGRRVATLASGWYEAGEHELDSDLARGPDGRAVAGVRFLRLEWAGRVLARTVVIVR